MGAFFGLPQAGDELTATRELKGSDRARNRHSVSALVGVWAAFGRTTRLSSKENRRIRICMNM